MRTQVAITGDVPAIEKSIAPQRWFVFEPMRHGLLLLCRDAAPVVVLAGGKALALVWKSVRFS